jgi:hypothetical protein
MREMNASFLVRRRDRRRYIICSVGVPADEASDSLIVP